MLLAKDNKLSASYYEASVARPAALPPLGGSVRADVCVVGGGLAGLSAALELAGRGYSVALLEARRIGWGASGRNGGQALVGFASDDAIEAQLSAEDARRAWHLTIEGLDLLRHRIAAHRIDCDFTPGYLSLAVNARKARGLDQWIAHVERAYNYPLQRVTPQDVGQWIASKRFHSGAYDANSGHLHPLKYTL